MPPIWTLCFLQCLATMLIWCCNPRDLKTKNGLLHAQTTNSQLRCQSFSNPQLSACRFRDNRSSFFTRSTVLIRSGECVSHRPQGLHLGFPVVNFNRVAKDPSAGPSTGLTKLAKAQKPLKRLETESFCFVKRLHRGMHGRLKGVCARKLHRFM